MKVSDQNNNQKANHIKLLSAGLITAGNGTGAINPDLARIDSGAQTWANVVGMDTVQDQFAHNNQTAHSVALGTGIANEIFGKDAVAQAIQQDQGHAATVASDLQHFQANSGWSTQQMSDYITANPNTWESDLHANVQAYQTHTGGGDEVMYLPTVSEGTAPQIYIQPQTESLPTAPEHTSQPDAGVNTWVSTVGQDAVNNAISANPNAAQQVAYGTNIAEQMFGHEADVAAIGEDAGHAAQVATELATFQKESGWSTEQMHDYVAQHDDWEAQLHQAVHHEDPTPTSEPEPEPDPDHDPNSLPTP